MIKYQHFLITRFNIIQDWMMKTKNGESTQSEKWLEERFEFFENICLPSVESK